MDMEAGEEGEDTGRSRRDGGVDDTGRGHRDGGGDRADDDRGDVGGERDPSSDPSLSLPAHPARLKLVIWDLDNTCAPPSSHSCSVLLHRAARPLSLASLAGFHPDSFAPARARASRAHATCLLHFVAFVVGRSFWDGTLDDDDDGGVAAMDADDDDRRGGGVALGGSARARPDHVALARTLAARGIVSSICSRAPRAAAERALAALGVRDLFVFASLGGQGQGECDGDGKHDSAAASAAGGPPTARRTVGGGGGDARPKGARVRDEILGAMHLRAADALFVDDAPINRAEALARPHACPERARAVVRRRETPLRAATPASALSLLFRALAERANTGGDVYAARRVTRLEPSSHEHGSADAPNDERAGAPRESGDRRVRPDRAP